MYKWRKIRYISVSVCLEKGNLVFASGVPEGTRPSDCLLRVIRSARLPMRTCYLGPMIPAPPPLYRSSPPLYLLQPVSQSMLYLMILACLASWRDPVPSKGTAMSTITADSLPITRTSGRNMIGESRGFCPVYMWLLSSGSSSTSRLSTRLCRRPSLAGQWLRMCAMVFGWVWHRRHKSSLTCFILLRTVLVSRRFSLALIINL